jgi:hypothetical protein
MPVSIFSPTRPDQFFHIIGGLPTLLAQGLRTLLRAWVSALLLSGCSAVRPGYNSAPELIYGWLESFPDFSDPQSVQVRADLAAGR